MFRSTRRPLPLLLLLLAAMAGGCGDDEPTTPTTPTPPTTVTETFSGTLTPNGAATHSFVSQTRGTLTATLTSVAPDNTVVMGLSLGTWNGVSCQVILAADRASQGTVVIGSITTAGNFCVRLYDVGNFTEPTSYEVQVVHP